MPYIDKGNRPERTCVVCGKLFKPKNVQAKYCSSVCSLNFWHKKQGRQEYIKNCPKCGDEFKTAMKTQIFCSRDCSYEYHHSDKGYPSNKEWELLVEFCLERDMYKCIKCGSDKKLKVHHILPLAYGGNNNISNLETLCSSCHGIVHKILSDNANNGD